MIREDLSSLPAYVPGKRQPEALKLSSNEATQPPLPAAVQAMSTAAAGANRYPDMGAVAIREALAAHLGVDFEQTAVGAGSSALCQQLVQVTCTKGDEVLFPWRSFEAYPIFAQVHGATPVAVPLVDQCVSLGALADAITDKTRLIFVCNPNNPTGTTVTRADFIDFMSRVPSDVVVALDEAYIEYFHPSGADTPLSTELIHDYSNLVGLRTFSKAYGLAGVRIGYAFGSKKLIDALNKVCIPFSVNAVAQAGALASLAAQDELLQRTTETIEQRARAAAHIGARPSQANFIWLPGLGPNISDKLAAQGVLVRSFPEGIRITITTSQETDQLLAAWDAI